MSDAPELKPCPFCGGRVKITFGWNGQYARHSDTTECPIGQHVFPIERWNRRADLPPTLAEALVEALTPSGDTKAAYMGEIKDPETKRMVSWTAIKMVMKIVSDRAALRAVEGE